MTQDSEAQWKSVRANELIRKTNSYYAHRAPWHDDYLSYTSNAEMEKQLGPLIERFEVHLFDRDVLEIACGTGNWTQVLAKRARSVTATDVNPETLAIARTKAYAHDRVVFKVVDAYAPTGLKGPFDVAFAADWWSHIPVSMIKPFVEGLHRYLREDGRVIMIDMMYREEFDQPGTYPDRGEVYRDREGSRIETRTLPDGSAFLVVKNFPGESELQTTLGPYAKDIEYGEDGSLLRWILTWVKR